MSEFEGELYDEFGNYIGPEDSEEFGLASLHEGNLHDEIPTEDDRRDFQDPSPSNVRDIVLHEDKRYYETAEETYGSAGVGTAFDCDVNCAHLLTVNLRNPSG
jgi:hypothetical protein